MKLVEINDRSEWDEYVVNHPNGHPLQLWGWGESKRSNGWIAHRLALVDATGWVAAVQVLLWRIPVTGQYIAYVPRGPVASPTGKRMQDVLDALALWAKQYKKIIYVRIEPAWKAASLDKDWKKTDHSIQMPKTYTLDITLSGDELLSTMSQKHRQYIRKSERDGVSVRRVTDSNLDAMNQLYLETAHRAKFGIHSKTYYEALHVELASQSHLYYAVYNNKPVAFLWLVTAGETAYELYGGVDTQGADLKANYYLKWQVLQDMSKAGYKIYDLNGRLNEGVSRFKEGFGPLETDYIGAYDFVVKRVFYYIWEYAWPAIKPIGRRLMRMKHYIKK